MSVSRASSDGRRRRDVIVAHGLCVAIGCGLLWGCEDVESSPTADAATEHIQVSVSGDLSEAEKALDVTQDRVQTERKMLQSQRERLEGRLQLLSSTSETERAERERLEAELAENRARTQRLADDRQKLSRDGRQVTRKARRVLKALGTLSSDNAGTVALRENALALREADVAEREAALAVREADLAAKVAAATVKARQVLNTMAQASAARDRRTRRAGRTRWGSKRKPRVTW